VVGVLGAGVMGSGIAQVLARGGYVVYLVDIDLGILRGSLDSIRNGRFGLMRLVERGKLRLEDVDEIMSRIRITTSYDELCRSGVSIIIEAVPEDPSLKKRILRELDERCPGDVIFASNTSSIMITELASAIKRKDKVIGMHWFNPAPVMPLIEVVRGALTSDETFRRIVELAKKLGKTPIEARDAPGFFTTRWHVAYLLEAIRLFENNVAGIREIDEMAKLAFRHPMGPFELMDIEGLDTVLHISEYLYNELGDPHYKPPLTLRKLVLAGYLGDPELKPGSRGGWYDYFGIPRPRTTE